MSTKTYSKEEIDFCCKKCTSPNNTATIVTSSNNSCSNYKCNNYSYAYYYEYTNDYSIYSSS